MTNARKIAAGGGVILGGQLASYALSFGRNVLIARLIGVEDFGVGATFALVFSFCEMALDFGPEKCLVLRDDGDSIRLQRNVHALSLLRSTIVACMLFLLSPLVGAWFEIPEATWAFRWLAVIALIRGLQHTDYFRKQRALDFMPGTIVSVVGHLSAAVVGVVAAVLLSDFRAMLFAVMTLHVSQVFVSHVVAERSYQIGWDLPSIRSLALFGWPLACNGFVLFGVMHGDRVLIGGYYSMEQLGIYAACATLLQVPGLAAETLVARLQLPVLAKSAKDPARFAAAYTKTLALVGVLASAIVLGGSILGEYLIRLLYGELFGGSASLMICLAVMNSIRLVRCAISQAALSQGHTGNLLLGNIIRSLGLFGLALIASMQQSIASLVFAAIIVEGIAAVACSLDFTRRYQITFGSQGRALGPFWVANCLSVAIFFNQTTSTMWVAVLGLVGAAYGIVSFVGVLRKPLLLGLTRSVSADDLVENAS